MTAGREQDARETLRALSEAATPGRWIALNGSVGSWDDEQLIADAMREEPGREEADAAFIAAAVNDVRAALLSSPPATTGEDADFHPETGHAHTCTDPTSCDCAARLYNLAASLSERLYTSPPATTGAGEALDAVEDSTRRIFMDVGQREGALWALNCVRERLAAASPPATDGDAAAREALSRVVAVVDEAEGQLRSDCWGDLVDDLRAAVGATETGAPGPAAADGDDE